jgi:hypothetical protein
VAKRPTATATAAPSAELDFDSHPRAFMKKHGAGMSGPKQLTLLLAHAAHGEPKAQHTVAALIEAWGAVEGVMCGGYAPVYVTRAKEQGWVNSSKHGTIHLTPSWRNVLSD